MKRSRPGPKLSAGTRISGTASVSFACPRRTKRNFARSWKTRKRAADSLFGNLARKLLDQNRWSHGRGRRLSTERPLMRSQLADEGCQNISPRGYGGDGVRDLR